MEPFKGLARPKIFVGSARESEKMARAVAEELRKRQLEPILWCDPKAFPLGGITIESLLMWAENVDGAVFVCTSDDQTTRRGQPLQTPRDNIVLELGIFLAHLGPNRTFVIKGQDTTLPSDFSGVTYLMGQEVGSAASEVAGRFVELFHAPCGFPSVKHLESLGIIIDAHLMESLVDHEPPPEWGHRRLYLGIEGAKRWLAVERDPNYWPRRRINASVRLLNQMVEGLRVQTLVTLGPGIADAGHRIAVTLQSKEPTLSYVPVDISEGLLFHAVKQLAPHVSVPAGILGDYEGGLAFICKKLGAIARRPWLIAMLDNNLGNLDGSEESYLKELSSYMSSGPECFDYLLLDVALAGKKWHSDGDPRCDYKKYDYNFQSFLSAGVRPGAGETIDEVVAEFEQRVGLEVGAQDSDVPRTQTVHLYEKATNHTILKLRRYDWEVFLAAVKAWGFEIMKEKATFDDDEVVGTGAILLRGRGRG